MRKKYFYLEREKGTQDRVRIRCNHELLNVESGAWLEVLPARLLGLRYDEYLLFCKQNFGSPIIGNHSLYPYPIFYRDEILRQFVRVLNYRLNFIITVKEKENANNA
jgi:hypothetical protein